MPSSESGPICQGCGVSGDGMIYDSPRHRGRFACWNCAFSGTSSYWLQTHSGQAFDLHLPNRDAVSIEDVATSLSRICRYLGHTSRFYSVAEHSLILSDLIYEEAGAELAYEALLHDAAEAYTGDIPRPMKQLLKCLPGFKEFEEKVERCVLGRFGIWAIATEVKVGDYGMLSDEKRVLMGPEPRPWHLQHPGYGEKFDRLEAEYRVCSQERIAKLFVQRYLDLKP